MIKKFLWLFSLILYLISASGILTVCKASDLPVKTVELSYTRDVFVSTGEDFSTRAEKLLTNSGLNTAMLEDKLVQLSGYSNGVLTFDGVPYKFGPLGEPEMPNEAFNAVHASDGNPINIDIPDGIYSSIRFIANSTGSSADNVSVSIYYVNDAVPHITDLSRVSSYRAADAAAQDTIENEYYVGKTGAIRSGGTYTGQLYAYYITPQPEKIVDKITINGSRTVVYAVSATGVGKDELLSGIEAFISSLPQTVSEQDRALVSAIIQLLDTAAEQGITDDEIIGIDKLYEADKRLIRVSAFEINTDIENINLLVRFSGPVSVNSLNTSSISVLHDNIPVSDKGYTITPYSSDCVQISICNNFDYTKNYSVRISSTVTSALASDLTLGSDKLITFIPEAPFEIIEFLLNDQYGNLASTASLKGKNVTAYAKIKNNTSENTDYIITIALFSVDGKMADKRIIKGSLINEEPEEISCQLYIPDDNDFSIECYAVDSLKTLKLLCNPKIAE